MSETFDEPLRIMAESLPQPVWTATAEGRHDGFNAQWYAFTGQAQSCRESADWWAAIHPEDAGALRHHWDEALRVGTVNEADARIRAADGRYRWFRVKTVPVRDAAGRVRRWLGTCTDIDALKTADETRQALAREMNHSVKNLFAVVSGLVSMTARSAKTPKDMADALRGRLGALSRAHELVRSAPGGDGDIGEATTLESLIQAVLAPYGAGASGDRLTIEGPAVPVGASTATNLALVLHELATNAAKYGALSEPRGRLAIRWSVAGDEVRLGWEEDGGPALTGGPETEGFGSQLAHRTVRGQLGGTLEPDWQPGGLRLRMTLSQERLAR